MNLKQKISYVIYNKIFFFINLSVPSTTTFYSKLHYSLYHGANIFYVLSCFRDAPGHSSTIQPGQVIRQTGTMTFLAFNVVVSDILIFFSDSNI